ncbi:phosphodiester glycosidase family protein [Vallitalea guaymasensis]|uniref:Phosphodiester glycosidase family protein n=1 Tax=Vallitalea guaymasensis TaxID=1185412 RepID=A0A8J8SAA4_9FIRM|nr:phosphodiester glycosidase family protein [Vallitalea guaymasensis]QUH27442.1 phosphodiester glycosidase family protein [Vallitalea guaymasensis]
MMIYKHNYVAGAYKRKLTKGYFQYLRYNYGSVKVDKAKGNEVIIDYALDLAYSKDKVDKYRYQHYYNKLKDYFMDFTLLEDYTDEEIYGDIHKIRQETFDKDMKDIYSSYSLDEEYISTNKLEKLNFDNAIINLIYSGIPKKIRYNTSVINKLEILKTKMMIAEELIFLAGDNKQLLTLLQIIVNNELLEFRDKKIVIYVKKSSIHDEATIDDYYDIMDNQATIESNDLIKKNTQIKIYDNTSVGMDFSKLEKEDAILFGKASSNKTLVIGLGEKHIFSLKNVSFDYFILSTVQNVVVSRYTNIYRNGSSDIPYIIGYVIKEFDCDYDFTGNERITMSLFHYNCLLNEYGIKRCREVFKSGEDINNLLPIKYMNFYSTSIKRNDFPEFLMDKQQSEADYKVAEREILYEFINNHFRGKYISCYYNADNIEKTTDDVYNHEHNNNVLVTGLLFDDNVSLKPVEAEKLNKSLISPREYFKNDIERDLRYCCNFLYFATDNIVEAYNSTRKELPNEKIDVGKIFLGYKYVNEDTNREEYFPLYNKAFIGCTKSGQVIFGRRTLQGGKIIINNEEITWDRDDVNSDNGNVNIITPYIDNQDLSKNNEDYRKFFYSYGKNRLNIVIINNKIVCVRYGEVSIPSIGVVLSVTGDYIKRLVDSLGLTGINDDYYKITKPYKLDVYLEKPEDMTQGQWDDISWVYGGATLLVENGKNLVSNNQVQIEAFKREGWFHPLSMQTQETQVQDWVRGPRTVVGLTRTNKFFVFVFSGRTKESCGANFNEIVGILEKEVGAVDWVMNLDGGASSCLSMIYKNQLIELSYPCTSDLSSAGMIRPINSMLIMK